MWKSSPNSSPGKRDRAMAHKPHRWYKCRRFEALAEEEEDEEEEKKKKERRKERRKKERRKVNWKEEEREEEEREEEERERELGNWLKPATRNFTRN